MLKKNTKNQFTESKDHKSNKNLNLNFIAIFLFLANRYIKNGLLRNRVWNEVVRITKEYS